LLEQSTLRRCGILLHISSLPAFDLCFDFIDFLKDSNQSYWQILPMNPVRKELSPYKCYSAFAGDTRYIGKKRADIEYEVFIEENQYWLSDYSLFTVLKKHFNNLPWNEWNKDIAFREKASMYHFQNLYAKEIEEENYKQYEFYASWLAVMEYAKLQGIKIIGDIPLYVSYDSADVWANKPLFNLNEKGYPKKLAGVPPDNFSKQGQLWGNPTYNWGKMKEDNYRWWKERISHAQNLADIIRFDHFRGLESYWEVDEGEKDAVKGRWIKGPGEDFLEEMKKSLKNFSIIAEDLGTITPEVIALKNRYRLPGMKVLQFSRDIYDRNTVVYTGTHDNDTLLGWIKSLKADNYGYAEHLLSYMGVDIKSNDEQMVWDIIKYAYKSIADTVIIPMQDILCLGREARMNIPGVGDGNWKWQLDFSMINKDIVKKLRDMSKNFSRTPSSKLVLQTPKDISEINQDQLLMFLEGRNFNSYEVLGSSFCNIDGVEGVLFTLWAPNAQSVSIVGDFNGWNPDSNIMQRHKVSEFLISFIPGLPYWSAYKYAVKGFDGKIVLKADPFAIHSETRPKTASKAIRLEGYNWSSEERLWQQNKSSAYEKPVNIYEMHLGSWKRGEGNRFLSYRELASELPQYVSDLGYTHIEIMPIMEHPLDASWGYQVTGYYSVSSRYGTPQDFMYFVDCCHKLGIGVILDWVPGHFCKDDHGLYQFDGTSLYEYQDMKKRENQNWGTAYFDLGKNEVISFLVSNAVFWLDVFHIDGLRTDAVASILYLDYEKNKNQWNPNKYDGRENLEAIKFLRILNEALFDRFPYIMSIAEESTSWPLVSAPCYMGGLGFNYKWNMGWMNDSLKYMEIDAIYRKWNHNLITFSLMYTYTENYVLPLSHDEVVHGKKSLIDKMWGDYWKKFASLRMFYAYMMAHPGKKLLFMGGEFAQFREWNFNESLEWSMIDFEMHGLMHKYVRHLNHFYKSDNSLWELDHNRDGFVWIDANNYNQSIISFIRRGKQERDYTIVICNFTPEVYEDYNVDVFELGEYEEVFNSDMGIYGGSNVTNEGIIKSIEKQSKDKPYSIKLRIPPLATIYIKPII